MYRVGFGAVIGVEFRALANNDGHLLAFTWQVNQPGHLVVVVYEAICEFRDCLDAG
jgi:hypothetical protein